MQRVAGFLSNVLKRPQEEGIQNVSLKPENEHGDDSDNTAVCKNEDGKSGTSGTTDDVHLHSITSRENIDMDDPDLVSMRETIYDLIKDIRDPEKPESLEELNVVCEEDVTVRRFQEEEYLVKIVFVPTVPHCSLATLIGLCLRQKLERNLPDKHKLDIYIKEGTHDTADEINKQINDKERIAAAMENPNLRKLVDQCLDEEEMLH